MLIYHFTDSPNITKFCNTKPQRNYSQASGYGVYFTPNYEKGIIKYGTRAKYCYVCEYMGDIQTIMDLGEFDSMYISSGECIHSSSLVTENFKRTMQHSPLIPEPEIQLEHLTKKVFNWLITQGFGAVKGMDSWGYACPEFCVVQSEYIRIRQKLSM